MSPRGRTDFLLSVFHALTEAAHLYEVMEVIRHE